VNVSSFVLRASFVIRYSGFAISNSSILDEKVAETPQISKWNVPARDAAPFGQLDFCRRDG
jgi:hypothetical protein